ncbi:hypothetical protein [Kitasatospora sp. NPDC050463]|uniref:hypothetical protein n=1 Tax=Kitasatospora sp. NPDC050463 TaxID=3155786 RepID=UPI0033CBC05B
MSFGADLVEDPGAGELADIAQALAGEYRARTRGRAVRRAGDLPDQAATDLFGCTSTLVPVKLTEPVPTGQNITTADRSRPRAFDHVGTGRGSHRRRRPLPRGLVA